MINKTLLYTKWKNKDLTWNKGIITADIVVASLTIAVFYMLFKG